MARSVTKKITPQKQTSCCKKKYEKKNFFFFSRKKIFFLTWHFHHFWDPIFGFWRWKHNIRTPNTTLPDSKNWRKKKMSSQKKIFFHKKKIFFFALKSFLNDFKTILRAKKIFPVFGVGEICLWIFDFFGIFPIFCDI